MSIGPTASIEKTLLDYLATLVTVPAFAVAWPNLGYEPVPGSSYLRASVLPNQTDLAGVGPGAAERHVGLFQVLVNGDENVGSAAVSDVADQVRTFFKTGTVIAGNGVRVRIGSYNGSNGVPWVSQGFNENGFRVIPVTIPYWCDIF